MTAIAVLQPPCLRASPPRSFWLPLALRAGAEPAGAVIRLERCGRYPRKRAIRNR